MERFPYRATEAAAAYDTIRQLPVVAFLDNVRSLYNVGAFFRTADAAGLRKLYLCGITGCPPHTGIHKTALGAEASVPWEYTNGPVPQVHRLRAEGCEIAAVETSVRGVDLFDWQPVFPVCVIFGNEIDGISQDLSSLADTHVRIPMLGAKHSLNVATAGGVVIYELLRKYRGLTALR